MQHRSGGGFDTPIRYMGLQLVCGSYVQWRFNKMFLTELVLVLLIITLKSHC